MGLTGAEEMLRRALSIQEKTDAPGNIAMTCKFLGSLLLEKGDAVAAEEMLNRSLRIFDERFGLEDEDGAEVCLYLAKLFKESKDDIPGAKQYMQRSLPILVKVYGPEHPKSKQARTRASWKVARQPTLKQVCLRSA